MLMPYPPVPWEEVVVVPLVRPILFMSWSSRLSLPDGTNSIWFMSASWWSATYFLLCMLTFVLESTWPPFPISLPFPKFKPPFAVMFLLEILVLLPAYFTDLGLLFYKFMPVKPEVRLKSIGPASAVPGAKCLPVPPNPPTPAAAVAVWADMAPPERPEMPEAPDIACVAETPPPSK